MFAFDALWSWLIRAAVLSSLVLIVGGLAISRVRQPAERLRVIQWVLVACLIAPCLPASSVWRTVSVNLIGGSKPSAEPASLPVAPSFATLAETISSHDSTMTQEAPAAVGFSDEGVEAARAPNATAPEASSAEQKPKATLKPDASRSFSLAKTIVATWALAVFAMFLWGLAGLCRRSSLQRRGRAPSTALLRVFQQVAGSAGSRVRLIVSDAIDSPMTWGTLRPVIVVPRKLAEDATGGELSWGLAHEWSHVKQRDMASLWLALAVQLVCFYQPLYWMLRRRMLLCQDYIADAFAARYAESAEDYAAFLIRLAKSRMQPATSLALGIVDGKSQLSHRVRMLVDSRADIQPNCGKRVAVLSACGALIGMLLLTTIQLDASEPRVRPPDGGDSKPDVVTGSSSTPSATAANATDEDALEAGVVSGILIDAADGKPVAGARVLLCSGGLATAESDEAGQFRFENVKAYPMGYELWAYRDNLITEKTAVKQLETADSATIKFKPLRLEMKPGKQVRFIVTAKDTGQPISRAAVRFGYPDRRNVTTGEDGHAMVSGLGSNRYDVTVETPGYSRSSQQLDLTQGEAASQYAVALVPGGEVQGVVVDDQGRPVPDAGVVYWEPGVTGYHGDKFRTDSDGRFRHQFLPLNVPLKVSVDKKDFLLAEEDISLTASQRVREVRLTLARRPAGGSVAGSVAGIVQDKSGKPLAGAQVANYGDRSSQERLTKTDAQGRFVLHDLFESHSGIEVRISSKGFSPQRLPVNPGMPQTPAQLSVKLEPGHTLRGAAVNEEGRPVKGAYVMARSSVYRWGMESVRTDDQGQFTFDSLPADVQFEVSHSDYASSGAIPLQLDGVEPVTITLEDPGVVQGRVLDSTTKQPLRQFRIRLGFSRDRRPGDATGSYNGTWSTPGMTFQDDNGRFKIAPLMARMPLELVVEADGYERLVIPRAVANKPASVEDLSISLTPKTQAEPYALTVRFLNDAGQPMPTVQLRLIVSTNQPTGRDDNAFNWVLIDTGQLANKSYVEQFLSGSTNAEGKYEFKDIAPGKFLQLAYWGDGVSKGRSLAFDETRSGQSDDVVIDVPRPAIVRGTLDRSKFADAGGVRISGDAESFLSFETKLAADQSTFELRDLPPGAYWISVDGKPVRFTENGREMSRISPLASQRLVLKPGDVKEVQFDAPDPPR